MPLFTVDEKVLNRHYIEEKFELSKSFAIALANFLLLSIPTYTFLTYFAKELVAKNNLVLAVYAVLSLIIKKITFPPKVTHMLAILLVCLVQARVIYVGLWIHPEFTSAYAVAGFLFLWHYHLEFTYDVMQGYGTIVAHLVIWCFCAVKSGQIKDFPPGDVFFLLGIVSYLQFRRYSYQVSNDRELIKRKLNLNAKQTNIQNLLNSVPEGVAVLNVNYQILMKNDSFEKLTQGYTLSDMKINQKFSVNKQNTFENLLQCIQEFQNSQEVTTTFGVCVCQRFYLECTGSKTEWNEHSALVLTFREVSNVIQLENEVNLNSKTLKILQGVSHELKTPLNQIINEHQDVLHRCEDISESLRMHLKKALSSSNYLLSLVKDMIDYSHIKFNNLGLDFSWIRIDEVISECILMVKEINSSCSISFQHDLAQSITVFTDQNRFKQSFLNLIFFSLG